MSASVASITGTPYAATITLGTPVGNPCIVEVDPFTGISAADAANARAQTHTAAARTAAQRIDDKAVILENASW